MTPRPTTTSFAVLGLLGVQPWTAYELVAQARRSLHYFWPRSEANLYAELKRLVERGYAEAEVVEGRQRERQRTRYTITPLGRSALEDWLGTEPAPASFEVEGALRVLLGDQGTLTDLRGAVAATASQVRELRAGGAALAEEILATGGPFPGRLHLAERVASLHVELTSVLLRWCDETLAEMETWPDTRDVGLTPPGRQRLKRLLADLRA